MHLLVTTWFRSAGSGLEMTSDEGHDDGEMSIVGLNAAGEAKAIQKITANKAVDYDGVIYSWAVEDDSAESMLRLTAL